MVMQSSVLDPQQQRKTSNMEDTSAMTIEFLRARLLSERSISRSARQRADELAKKVIELEEQLRMVSLQRKMAEKATADVLAILENQGFSDVGGEFDLGSDLEITSDSGVSDDSVKGGERSTSSKGRKHGSDELSGSSVDYSPAPVSGRSLSWKGRLDSSRFLEKYKTSNVRRSFSSNGSSPRHRLGRSCRRIKHTETRSVAEDSRDKPVNLICQENEAVSSSEGLPHGSNGGSNIPKLESKTQEGDESELKLANKKHDIDGCKREKSMEKALEHRAQLIDQNEAMEKAQREWEEKYRENNTSTPDSFDVGNHSDITEERDESKSQIPCSAGETTFSAQQDKSEVGNVTFSEAEINAKPIDNMPKPHTGSNDQKNATVGTSGLLQGISLSQLNANKNENPENCHSQPSDRHHQGPYEQEKPNSKPTDSMHTDVFPGNKSGPSESGFHEQFHTFSGVLESLKQARLSLQEEIKKSLLVESGDTGKAINPLASVSASVDRHDIPVGYSGLFRVPTDFSGEARAGFNAHDSTSRLDSKFYLGRGVSGTSGDQVGTNPYLDTMFSAENQSLVPRYSTPFVPSGSHMYHRHPVSTSYKNATRQMLFEGHSIPYTSSMVGVPPVYNFSFHSDHAK